MAKKPKPEPDDKEQSQRFVKTARKLEADESGKSFERAIKSMQKGKHHSKTKVRRPAAPKSLKNVTIPSKQLLLIGT